MTFGSLVARQFDSFLYYAYIQSELLDCYDANFSVCLRLSDGTLEGGINPYGIKYYKNLINLLVENGINPIFNLICLRS